MWSGFLAITGTGMVILLTNAIEALAR